MAKAVLILSILLPYCNPVFSQDDMHSRSRRQDSQGNCMMVNPSDLGSQDSFSEDGIIAEIVDGEVQLVDFNVVCLSSGSLRNTYRSASVLAEYNCRGSCFGGTGLRINQFTFECGTLNQWVAIMSVDGSLNDSIRTDSMATMTTPLETFCANCMDPRFNEASDSITHCESCSAFCQRGAALCIGPRSGPDCCSFYMDDMCTPDCNLELSEGANNTCVPLSFGIGGMRYTVEVQPVLYIYDAARGSPSPLNIMCPTSSNLWNLNSIREESLSECPCPIPGTESVALTADSTLSLNIRPPSTFTVFCLSEGSFGLTITTDNPYLMIRPIEVLAVGQISSTLTIESRYTLSGGVALVPRPEDFQITITDMSGEEGLGGIIFVSQREHITTFLLNATDLTVAEVTARIDINGLIAQQSITVTVQTIPPLPSQIILSEADELLLNCTPTTTSSLVMVLFNGNAIAMVPGLFRTSRVELADSGIYTCVGYNGSVVRSTEVIVFSRNSEGVELFDDNFRLFPDDLPADYIFARDSSVFTQTVHCYGSSENSQLSWSVVEDSRDLGAVELQQLFAAFNGQAGRHQITFPLFGIFYILEYSGPGASINKASLTVDSSSLSPNLTIFNNFSCADEVSGVQKGISITSSGVSIQLLPSTSTSPSLGRSFNFELQVAFGSGTVEYRFGRASMSLQVVEPVLSTRNNAFFQIPIETAVVTRTTAGDYLFRVLVDAEFDHPITITPRVPTLSLTPSSPLIVDQGENVTLECIPSDPLVQVFWIPSGDIFIENLNDMRLTFIGEERTGGIYQCLVTGNVDSVPSATIEVLIRLMCERSYSAGVFWPAIFATEIASVSCNSIDSRFSNFLRATRYCDFGRLWSEVDFSNCTFQSLDEAPFLLLWLSFEAQELPENIRVSIKDIISTNVILYGNVSIVPDTASIRFETENLIVNLDQILITPAVYRVSLDLTAANGLSALVPDVSAIRRNFISVVPDLEEIIVFHIPHLEGAFAFQASEECECFPYQFSRPMPIEDIPFVPTVPLMLFQQLCAGTRAGPCNCFVVEGEPIAPSPCQCAHPFIGDGERCVLDADGDEFPNRVLSTCGPEQREMKSPSYCASDTCPMVFNIPQSNTRPCTGSANEIECTMETDMVYGLNWGFTSASQTSTQPCGMNFIGDARRVCGDNGIWLNPNVSSCLSIISVSLQQISSGLLVGEYNGDNAQEALNSLTDLAAVTMPTGLSQLPSDLEVNSEFLLRTIDYLLLGINQTNATEVLLMESLPFVEVLSNLVSTDNLPGAQQLMEERPDSAFSQNLLHTAERYGLYLASLLEQNEEGNLTIAADNIIVNAKAVLIDDELADITFPSTQFTDEVNMTSRFSVLNRLNEVSVVIPASVLRERASMGSHARVSNIVYQNIEQFLPSNDITNRNISLILSSQVERQGGDSNQILPDPAVINFSFPNQILDSLNCVFFDFNNPPNVGSFSSDGITTEVIVRSGNGTSETVAQCTSNHLTSFAVLVNVGDHSSVSSDTALNVVSYIGLGVSLACLLVTIIFFLTFGKKLFSGVHNLVHLNLAIALFLAYLVFAIGVDLAADNDTICKVVAALLQYLFLAVFCWMLCEGIMLYLMLVVVFSSLSKKWWLFFLLGWLPPLVFVAIGLAIFVNKDDGYGVYDHDQGVLLFCWLSSNNGAIWTFVGPMIAVIVINTVFLVLVLYSIIKSYRTKRKQIMKDKGIKVDLVITTVKASLILLPLLGLTWLFGLFTVNENTVIFAWIFTILNTLQGLFILIFHVLRHERIWGRFKKKYNNKQSTKPSNSDTKIKFTASAGSDKLRQSNPTANTFLQSQSEKVMETEEYELEIKA